MDYGHGSSLTDLLRPREDMQAHPGEALATTKCQVNPQEPAYRTPGLQDSYYPTTSLHTPPQHCLGLDIVASHLTSTRLVGGQQQQQQVHLNSGGGGGGGHLTRPRQQANLFSSLSSSSSSPSPPTAQHYPDFPTLLQFAPEPLSPPGSHQHQYTLPCNRRVSQPATVHLDKAWSQLDPPERFNHPSKKANGHFENTTKGLQSKVQQQQQQSQPRKAPLPPSICHNFSGKIRN